MHCTRTSHDLVCKSIFMRIHIKSINNNTPWLDIVPSGWPCLSSVYCRSSTPPTTVSSSMPVNRRSWIDGRRSRKAFCHLSDCRLYRGQPRSRPLLLRASEDELRIPLPVWWAPVAEVLELPATREISPLSPSAIWIHSGEQRMSIVIKYTCALCKLVSNNKW